MTDGPTADVDDRRSRPPMPTALSPLGRALEPWYRAVIWCRNRALDRGSRVQRVAAPVISVGNLSVGGTGKTPMVSWVVDRLRERGHRPGIALRGYKAKADGESDEHLEHRRRSPGVPVVADPDRVRAAKTLINQHGADVVVLDDGFQHRRLGRDLDIVLLDATRNPFMDRLLPAGWLREPVDELARADVIVWTRADLVPRTVLDEAIRLTRRAAPRATIASARHHWARINVGDERPAPIETVRSIDVVVALGIGHPTAFVGDAKRHGFRVVDLVIRNDHHAWSAEDVAQLLASLKPGQRLLTTEKDWTKLSDHLAPSDRWRVLRPELRMELIEGERRTVERLDAGLEAFDT